MARWKAAHKLVDAPSPCILQTPIQNRIVYVSGCEQGICRIDFEPFDAHCPPALFAQLQREFEAYFSGKLRQFSVPYVLTGSPFQRRILEALAQVPYAQTWTYGQLAQHAGMPQAARATGTVCAHNPLPILLPCHRIVKADHSVGNYTPDPTIKHFLLALEQTNMV